MEGFSAVIEEVDVVDKVNEGGGMWDKGVGVLKSRISLISAGQHVEYLIRVERAGDSYVIRKRFSEFAALHEVLKKRFGLLVPADLPSKTVMRTFDPSQLEDRKHALNAYMKSLSENVRVLEMPEVQKFFAKQELQTGSSSLSAPTPATANANSTSTTSFSNPFARSTPAPAPAPGGRHDDEDDLVGWDR